MIYIIRHGQTMMNRKKVLQGRSNQPLNEDGLRQAREAIRELQGNILISTHAIAMKGLLEYLTPNADGRYWSEYIGNCEVYRAENRDGRIGVPKSDLKI